MPILELIAPRKHDLGGGFTVSRVLPSAKRQAVGPFIFFDHFGPIQVHAHTSHDVRPHPHIGLATVTYLFSGAMMHRDSLGYVQKIEPGAINWMTAGNGVVHSERIPDDAAEFTNHGLQLWLALPQSQEDIAANFHHTPAENIPSLELPLASVRVLIGQAFGLTSPVITYQDTLYLDIQAQAGAEINLPASALEQAVYCIDHTIEIDGMSLEPQQLAILQQNVASQLRCPAGARLVIIGGSPLDGHRFIWWNFVSSNKEKIQAAKIAWAEQKMGTVPGETEWIPLPP